MRHGPPGCALGRSSQRCGLPGPGGRLSAAVRPPYQTTIIHLPAPPAPDTAMAPAPGPAASQSHLRLFVPLAPLLSPALTGSATSSYLRRRVAVCLQVRRVKRCWTDVSHLLARRQRVWTRHWTTHMPTTQLTRTRTSTVRHDDARNPMGSPRLRRGTPILPPHSNAVRSHASARLAARQRAEGTGRHEVFPRGGHIHPPHTHGLWLCGSCLIFGYFRLIIE